MPPSFRYDLLREVDLIEEIGRVFGFEHTPTRLPHIAKPLQEGAERSGGGADFEFLSRIKGWAKGLGFKEAINYSFVGRDELNQLGVLSEELIPLENPLTSDQDTLRPVLAPGLLQNIRHNVDQNNRDLRLFEVARSFHRDDGEETGSKEQALLGLVLHGNRNPLTWPWSQEEADYADLKGSVEHLLESLHLPRGRFLSQERHPYLEPCARLEISGELAGTLGKLKPGLGKAYHARSAVWLAELNLDLLHRLYRRAAVAYRPWSKFPPVFRDMTLIAGQDVSFADIEQAISHSGIPHLETFLLLDLYQPKQRSECNLTLRMIYRHEQRTLTDKEVDAEHHRLGQTVLDSLPVRFP
jgi:phenylalanyl-tRNA synthetase beta chain